MCVCVNTRHVCWEFPWVINLIYVSSIRAQVSNQEINRDICLHFIFYVVVLGGTYIWARYNISNCTIINHFLKHCVPCTTCVVRTNIFTSLYSQICKYFTRKFKTLFYWHIKCHENNLYRIRISRVLILRIAKSQYFTCTMFANHIGNWET